MTGSSPLAEVIVDRPVGYGRRFHYIVPQQLAGRVQPGVRVRVPFGPDEVVGMVTGLADEAPVPPDRLRPLAGLLDDVPLLTQPMLALVAWLERRYLCRPEQALGAMAPGVFRAELGPRVAERFFLAVTPAAALEAAEAMAARAPKQAAVLRLLASTPEQAFGASELARRVGSTTSPVRDLEKKGLLARRAVRQWRDEAAEAAAARSTAAGPTLSDEQHRAFAAIAAALEGGNGAVLLVDGVTGSGKTELYLRAAERVLASGRQVLVVVPEIALSPQMVRRFRRRLAGRLAVLHSGMGLGQRYDAWGRIRQGEVDVAIGARSAIFAPFPALGLIVIDEEHEDSYKQEEAPCYDARDVALHRAARERAVLLLGSATPRLESVQGAAAGRFQQLRLRRRVGGGTRPRVTVVDLREELARGETGLFSSLLLEAAQAALGRDQQVLLFLNRRGFANYLFCRGCGTALDCADCSVTLTLHRAQPPLWCHYCGERRPLPERCPACGEVGTLQPWGSGTQQVAEAAQAAFPGARVLRMDRDTTRRQGAHRRIYLAFRSGEADILVGTQMVAKGWDIPRVTVAGIVLADTTLNLPDYRAPERTFQLITQVVGRTGRSHRGGLAVVQTYQPEHPAIAAAVAGDAAGFYRQELADRRHRGLPPFAHLIRLLVSARDEGRTRARAEELAAHVRARGSREVDLLGPAAAPIRRLRGRYRWHLVLRGRHMQALQAAARELQARHEEAAGGEVRLRIDVGPVNMW